MDQPATDAYPTPPSERGRGTSREHRRILAGIVVVGALGLWIPQLGSSFTADETVTHWVVSDGWNATLDRAYAVQQQHSLYFVILRGFKELLGSSEVALRLPSLVALGVAAVLVWRLVRRLVDDEADLLAAAVFVTTPGIIFAAGDARPYGFAIVSVVASSFFLVRWADTRSKKDTVGYVILSAAAIYFHYLAVIALAAHPFYVWKRRERIRPRDYAAALIACGALIAPAIPHALSVFDRRAILEINFPVSASDLFDVLVPPVLVGSIVLGLLLVRLRGSLAVERPPLASGAAGLMLGTWILPPLILYIVTRLGSTLFEPRYLFFALPGLAFVGGATMRVIAPPPARRTAALSVAVIALLLFNTRVHSGENWRAAAEAERAVAGPDTPVLFRPNFIESSRIDWLARSDKLEYLLAELSPYPMEGTVIPIPYDLNSEAAEYLEPIIGRIRSVPRFLLVNDRGAFRPWIEGRLPEFGVRIIPDGGVVTIVVFERRAS